MIIMIILAPGRVQTVTGPLSDPFNDFKFGLRRVTGSSVIATVPGYSFTGTGRLRRRDGPGARVTSLHLPPVVFKSYSESSTVTPARG